MKVIRYNSPAKLGGTLNTIGGNDEVQFYCKGGGNLFRIRDNMLSDAVNACIGRFDEPYPITVFSCSRGADRTTEALYQELPSDETAQSDLSSCGKAGLPSLETVPTPEGIGCMDFVAEDDPIKINCRMYFDPTAPIYQIIIYANDLGDGTEDTGAKQLFEYLFREKGNTALITFDWPNHGKDQRGSFRPEDCSAYLATLSSYIRNYFDPQKLSVFAVGFGAYCVMRYIRDSRNPFNRIVLFSPILNVSDGFFERLLTRKDREELLKDNTVQIGIRARARMNRVEIKAFLSDSVLMDNFAESSDDIFIIAGTEDTYASTDSLGLFAKTNNIRHTFVEHADHNFTNPEKREIAYREAENFFNENRPIILLDLTPTIIRRGYIFSGNVYGVGFCWRAVTFAYEVGASGWIQEKSDGTVHMVIESTETRINLVIMKLRRVASFQIKECRQVDPDVLTFSVSDDHRGQDKDEVFSWGDFPFCVGKKEKLEYKLFDSNSSISLRKKNTVLSDAGVKVHCTLYYLEDGKEPSETADHVEAASKHFSQVILSGHGFGSHRENYAAERFAESYLENHRSAAVLAFDLPCHGKDQSKNLTMERCDTYLRVVIRYLKKQLTADMIFGYAIDFSGYLFLRYIHAHENPFRGIALLCPALNAARDLKEAYKERNPKTKYAKIFRNSEMFGRYNKIEEILSLDYTAFSDSLLILHGTEDELTPVKTVKSFADKNQICFIPIEQGDHRFLDPAKMNIAIHRITEHFDSLNLRPSLSNKVKSEEILQPIR